MKRSIHHVWSIAFLVAFTMPLSAYAQKGVGDASGVARQREKPAIVEVAGVLEEVSTHPCKHTTGNGVVGTHLILKTQDKHFNLHLGPALEVKDVVDAVKTGEPITAQAFRTEKMPEDHFNAVTVTSGETTFELRNESLRPRWARSALASSVKPGDSDSPKTAAESQKVVVHLSHFTDDLHRCFMAFKLANLMKASGAQVTIFLDLEGVRLAERRQHLDLTWGSNSKQLGELYEEFIESGGKVALCPHCANAARIFDPALKRNAYIATMDDLGKMLMEADKIMDY